MEELVKQTLEVYFSDFKEYHLFILIGFTVAIGLIQVIQSMWVSRKIERFKNDLKKTEIKFSKYNQLQIDALGEIFQLLTDFLVSTKVIEKDIDSSSPERVTKITKNWLSTYSKVYSLFSKKKYILPKKMKDKFDSIISQLNDASGYLESEKNMSDLFYTSENGEVEFMGNDNDRSALYDELDKYNKNGVIKSTLEIINELRMEIETYFEKIE